MSKTLADLIHKTPWLGLLLGAVATLALLVLFSLPMQVIHLVERGETAAERHAIRHEVGVAAGNQALDLAQRVVNSLRERTTDVQRQRELDRALTEIARASGELAQAYTGFGDDAAERARDALEAAQEAASDAAEAALEAAIDARVAIEDIRHETLEHLRDNGVDVSSALQSFDQMLATARAKEDAARESLATLRTQPAAAALETERYSTTPPLVLPPAVKDNIHSTVAGDAWRVGVGAALVVLAIPVLLALTLAKFFIGRARHRAQAAAMPAQTALPLTATSPARATGWRRGWKGVRTVHGLWASLLGHSFIVMLVILTGLFVAGLLALLLGWLPVHVGDLPVDGLEGLAIGSTGLLAAFGAAALALAIVLAVVYGLGFLFAGLAVFIPAVILLGMLPFLAPLILMAVGLWSLFSRRSRV